MCTVAHAKSARTVACGSRRLSDGHTPRPLYDPSPLLCCLLLLPLPPWATVPYAVVVWAVVAKEWGCSPRWSSGADVGGGAGSAVGAAACVTGLPRSVRAQAPLCFMTRCPSSEPLLRRQLPLRSLAKMQNDLPNLWLCSFVCARTDASKGSVVCLLHGS